MSPVPVERCWCSGVSDRDCESRGGRGKRDEGRCWNDSSSSKGGGGGSDDLGGVDGGAVVSKESAGSQMRSQASTGVSAEGLAGGCAEGSEDMSAGGCDEGSKASTGGCAEGSKALAGGCAEGSEDLWDIVEPADVVILDIFDHRQEYIVRK